MRNVLRLVHLIEVQSAPCRICMPHEKSPAARLAPEMTLSREGTNDALVNPTTTLIHYGPTPSRWINNTSTPVRLSPTPLYFLALSGLSKTKVYRNTYVCNLCLLTLTISFTADLYPGAPSHNVPMSAALLWACSNVDGVRALRRRSFAYALSVVVLLSLFMDIDFLASDLKVERRVILCSVVWCGAGVSANNVYSLMNDILPSSFPPYTHALPLDCTNCVCVSSSSSLFAYLSCVSFVFVAFLFGSLTQAYALSQLEQEDDDLQRVIVENNMHTFGRIIVGIVAGLKALSWQGLLATSPQVCRTFVLSTSSLFSSFVVGFFSTS